MKYDVLDCNDVLMDKRVRARGVTLEQAAEIAAVWMPRPANTRRFARIVARPVGGDSGAEITLRRGEA